MKELTRAEEQIMQVLWSLGKAYVKDIIERLPAPKPAYNTVSTIVRILEKKGFVGHEAFGKTHLYSRSSPKRTTPRPSSRASSGTNSTIPTRSWCPSSARDRSLTVSELEEILAALGERSGNKRRKNERPRRLSPPVRGVPRAILRVLPARSG